MNEIIVMAYDKEDDMYTAMSAYAPLYSKSGAIDLRIPVHVTEELKGRHLDSRV